MSSQQPIIDCHSDVVIDVYRRRRAGERSVLRRVHHPSYVEGGVVGAVCTVGGDAVSQAPFGLDQAYRSTLAMLDALYADVAESGGVFEVVATATEMRRAIAGQVFAILPALEGAMPIEGDLQKLEELYERGIRVVGLTWNSRNALAVGLESGEGGLTDLGVRAIERMNDLGILIDLSHASSRTFWDVRACTQAPLFVSHANARSIHDHPRNLDNEQLQAIADAHGAVGVVFCPTFISSPPATLGGILEHIDYLRRVVGDDGVVIGADFIDYAIEEMNAHVAASTLYDSETANYPPGIESVRSMQNVVKEMRKRGLDGETIAKISRDNFLRLLDTTQAGVSVACP